MRFKIGDRVRLIRSIEIGTIRDGLTTLPVGTLGTVRMPFRGPEDKFLYSVTFDEIQRADTVSDDALADHTVLDGIVDALSPGLLP